MKFGDTVSEAVRWRLYYLFTMILYAATFMALKAYGVLGSATLDTAEIISMGLAAILFLLPFYFITLHGIKKNKPRWIAVGSGYLLWALFIGLPSVYIGKLLPSPLYAVYIFQILTGLYVIHLYRLPRAYTFMAIVFPGFSTLYFFIFGLMPHTERASGEVVA